MNIPTEAITAARRAVEREFPYDENNEYIVRLVLEAAAPHLWQIVETTPSGVGFIRTTANKIIPEAAK